QQRILQTISDFCDYPKNEIEIGVDGCGVPVHGIPLKNLAYGFARMAKPETLGKEMGEHARSITKAMAAAPEMVGGTNRFCTDFMRVGEGRFFGKAGAEGVYCIGDMETGLGILVIVADGNVISIYSAAIEALVQLEVLTDYQKEELKEYHHSKLINTIEEIIRELVHYYQ